MPSRRSGCVAQIFGNSIFVFGGESNVVLNSTEEFVPEKNQWKCRTPMSTGRTGLAAANVNSRIYLMAGGI